MKTPLSILALVSVTLGVFYLFAPPPYPADLQPRTDLPWQLTVNPVGTSHVFELDLKLGTATVADAMTKFGGLDGLALFEPKQGEMLLEGYFGILQMVPLTTKVIDSLAATEMELVAMRAPYSLPDLPADHRHRRLRGISYIPGTRTVSADRRQGM